MSTGVLLEEGKDRRDRRIRNGSAELPGSCISTKIDQSLPAVAEALPARNCYEGYGGKTFVMFHGTSRENWRSMFHRTRRLYSIQRRWFGSRSVCDTQRAEGRMVRQRQTFFKWGNDQIESCTRQHELGSSVEINAQGHPLQKTWMEHGAWI